MDSTTKVEKNYQTLTQARLKQVQKVVEHKSHRLVRHLQLSFKIRLLRVVYYNNLCE